MAAKKTDKTQCAHKGKFNKELVEAALKKAKGSKVMASSLLNCARSTLDRYINKYPDLADVYGDIVGGHLDVIEQVVFRAAKKGNITAATFILRTLGRNRGYVEFKPQAAAMLPHEQVRNVLIKLRNGEIAVSDAAIDLEIMGYPVPETIRTLLAREDRQPPDPSAGQYASISDEEFERRAAERKAEIAQQRGELEVRRDEVKVLRDEARDTFAPEQDGGDGVG